MAGLACNHLKPALQLAQRAGTRQLTFGKQAHRIAGVQGRNDDPDRLPRLIPADRHGIVQSDNPADQRLSRERLVHHKAHRSATGGGNEKGIPPGHVIRQQQHPARLRQPCEVEPAESIDKPHQAGA